MIKGPADRSPQNLRQVLRAVTLLFALTVSAAGPAKPTENGEVPVGRLTQEIHLPGLIKLAVQRNPELKAARLSWGAALEKVPQAKAWPDPMISYLHYDESVETRVGPQEARWGLTQNMPFPGTLSAAGKVALERAKIAQVKHEMALRNLIVNVKTAFHEIAYLERAIVITRQNQKLLKHTVKVANNLYSKDKATLNDVLKAQTQLAQLDYDLVLLNELLLVEHAQLAAYLNLPGDAEFGETVVAEPRQLELSLKELETRAMAQRQELRIAAGKIALAEQQLRHARFRVLPKFSLSVMKIETGDAVNPNLEDSGKDALMYGAGMTIPWNFRKNSAAVKEAELKRDAAVNSRKAVANNTSAMLRKLYFRLENSRRLLQLYEKSLIPQAKKAMSIAETWNVDGQKNFSSFLETQSVWLNFNLARLRAATDYQQDLAAIERLVGTHLDRDKTNQPEGTGEDQ